MATQGKIVTFDRAIFVCVPDKKHTDVVSSQEEKSWNPSSVTRQMRNVLVLPSSQADSSLGLSGPVHVDYSVNPRRRRALEESIRQQNYKDDYGGHENAPVDSSHYENSPTSRDEDKWGGTSDARSLENSVNQSVSGKVKHVNGETKPRIPTPPPFCKRVSDSHEYHITMSKPKKSKKYKKLGSTCSSMSSKSSTSAYTGGFGASVDLDNDMTSCQSKQDKAEEERSPSTSESGMEFETTSDSE